MSVTVPILPAVVLKVTVPPLALNLLPLASFACTVRVEVLVPLARMEPGLALIAEFAADSAFGVKMAATNADLAAVPAVALKESEPELRPDT